MKAAAASRARAEPIDQTGLDHLVGYATSRAAIEMRKVFTSSMEPLELRVAEYSILMLVAHNDAINQKRLCAALDLSPPNLAVMLDRMAERGIVERVRGTEDRRAQHIHLTASGRELAARAKAIAATMEEARLAVLTHGERALLLELLEKLYRSAEGRRAA